MKKIFILLVLFTFFAVYLEENAFARAGGGRSGGRNSSFGSRGSRTYNAPAKPAPSQNQYQYQREQTQQQRPVSPAPMPQSPSRFGGFMRSLAGGLAGGFIGALLFRSLGFGGGFGSGGFGGIGLLDILLLAIGIFVIYKLVKSRKPATAPSYEENYQRFDQGYNYQPVRDISTAPSYGDDLTTGLSRIRQFDPSFDENRFKETATDIFFKVQAAWMNRDIESSKHLFAPEILELMRNDVTKMKAEGRINRLENIAMRNVEITEIWQEQGKDYIAVEINANVLDYITDESGRLIEGSRTEPVKFLEYWTFVRTVGTGAWQLTAIQQAE